MEFDAVQAFLKLERERRKTPRERQLEAELREIAERHRRELVKESEPLFKELAQIEANKPPMPLYFEGHIYRYDPKEVA